jgi:uncharacterized protein (DUF1501 family)
MTTTPAHLPLSHQHLDGRCSQSSLTAPFSRRNLLRGVLAGVALTPVLGLLEGHVAYATEAGWTGDTLVVLSFRGGMDGLSAIVPAADPAYYSNRPTIGIPAAATIPLDNYFGLHPALAPLKTLWNAGQFIPVVAAGLPQPNRSHFDAMVQMEAANPGSDTRTGWLGRLLGQHSGQNSTFTAAQIGGGGIPTSLRVADTADSALGLDSVAGFTLSGTNNDADRAHYRTVLAALHDAETAAAAGTALRTLDALDTAAAIATSYPQASGDNPNPNYPNSDLGKALADTARMIKANVGLKVATLDMGDWDMHSGLGTPGSGWMHDNLTDLAAALTAFVADIGPAINNTTLVTLSEFGRRVQENESAGLDHGWGNVMLVIGGHVTPQKVIGSWPTLADAALTDGDVTATTDYRAVLADILAHRCAAGPDLLAAVFPNYTGLGSLPGVTTS